MRCRALLPARDHILIERIDDTRRDMTLNGLYTDKATAIHLLTLSAAELITATGAPA
jgi:hypothetical protein